MLLDFNNAAACRAVLSNVVIPSSEVPTARGQRADLSIAQLASRRAARSSSLPRRRTEPRKPTTRKTTKSRPPETETAFHLPLSGRTMPICIECRYPAKTLWTQYSGADDGKSSGHNIRLTVCRKCGRFCDKYVEHDFVVLFIDLVLIKPQVSTAFLPLLRTCSVLGILC